MGLPDRDAHTGVAVEPHPKAELGDGPAQVWPDDRRAEGPTCDARGTTGAPGAWFAFDEHLRLSARL